MAKVASDKGNKYADRFLALAMTFLKRNGITDTRTVKGELDFREDAQSLIEEIVEGKH